MCRTLAYHYMHDFLLYIHSQQLHAVNLQTELDIELAASRSKQTREKQVQLEHETETSVHT